MQSQVPRTLTVHGRTYELRKDATDPTQQFPYNLIVPLNNGCTKIADGKFCCWVRGVIPPRPRTIERPMEVVALGFAQFEVPGSALTLPGTLERMHYYVANDDSFMADFAGQFLGLPSAQSASTAADVPPVEILPFPKDAPKAPETQEVVNA